MSKFLLVIVLVIVALIILGVILVALMMPTPVVQAPPTAAATPAGGVQPPPTAAASDPAGENSQTVTSAPASSCRISHGLPDPSCTPGATNPNVTQSNIGSTICVPGFTRGIRPPASYTDALKVQQMAAYGLSGSTRDYEEDHLIPLEIGGDPRDPRNLWPQPRAGEPNAGEKDRFENYLHREVCAGRLALADAQRSIASDWFGGWIAAGRP